MWSSLQRFISVIVDDDDSTLTYSPSNWTMYTDEGMNEVGEWGPPYRQTLHRISGDGSVSLLYNGTFIHAYASFNNTARDSLPKWKCFVDGFVIPNAGLPLSPNNNWEICNSAGLYLSQSMHNFTLEVTGVGNNTRFWLDWIAYEPLDGYVVNEGTMHFSPRASGVGYNGDWQRWGPYTRIGTVEAGASALVSYKGVSASWYGFLWGVTRPSIGHGVYTVDGGTPTPFTWESHRNQTTYRHLFFKTPAAQLGTHNLNVTFLNSTPELVPLSFTRLYVEVHSNTNVTTTPAINLDRLAAIYGGVLGGLTAIFLFGAIGCTIAWKHRQKLRWKPSPASEQPAETAMTEAAISTTSNDLSKEPTRENGLVSKSAPVPLCEDERRQELRMSPGPSTSRIIS